MPSRYIECRWGNNVQFTHARAPLSRVRKALDAKQETGATVNFSCSRAFTRLSSRWRSTSAHDSNINHSVSNIQPPCRFPRDVRPVNTSSALPTPRCTTSAVFDVRKGHHGLVLHPRPYSRKTQRGQRQPWCFHGSAGRMTPASIITSSPTSRLRISLSEGSALSARRRRNAGARTDRRNQVGEAHVFTVGMAPSGL